MKVSIHGHSTPFYITETITKDVINLLDRRLSCAITETGKTVLLYQDGDQLKRVIGTINIDGEELK